MTLLRTIRFLATLPLLIYQKTLSYDHGPMKVFYPHGYCQFYPSCSEYGVRAVMKYGVVRGYAKAFWRVLRCNPWSEGGVDEP